MAVTITVEQVKTNPIASGFTDDVLNGFISFIDGADECLDANGLSSDLQATLKLYGVWAMCYTGMSGNVKSERSPNGASISYGDQTGVTGSPFGQSLQLMDKHWCVLSLFGQTGNSFIFGAVVA